VSERYVDASRLEAMLGVKAKAILDAETDVLDALQFDLVVYHPYRNIDALVEARFGGPAVRNSLSQGDPVHVR